MKVIKIICAALGLAGVIVGIRTLCARRKYQWL